MAEQSIEAHDEKHSANEFWSRHIGPNQRDTAKMLRTLGFEDLDGFIEKVIAPSIRQKAPLKFTLLPQTEQESAALDTLKAAARKNKVWRSYIGMGYFGCLVPGVIQRNILENPGWYTQYTPYQPEISQGRLEALFNFQTLVSELTGFPVTNASLLDEGTAAAEAMILSLSANKKSGSDETHTFLVDSDCHPQTIEVVKTRAEALGVEVLVEDLTKFDFKRPVFGALLSYPTSSGAIHDLGKYILALRNTGALVTMVCDPLALCLLETPAKLGADIAVGSMQRFGVPVGFGGPHAAYFATKEDYKRLIPGRIVGLTKDSSGKLALRLALQTREQHIRREKATSNICTAQVLLAIMASMYGVYHGPKGLKQIAKRVHSYTANLGKALRKAGLNLRSESFFDTLFVELETKQRADIVKRAADLCINLRTDLKTGLGVSLDESVSIKDLEDLYFVFTGVRKSIELAELNNLPKSMERFDDFLLQEVFSAYHSETELLRYIRRLEAKDLSLAVAMIPLGSCTMKLNATVEMQPVSWPEFSAIHPFAPRDQWLGYQELFQGLESALAEITGFSAVSLQPNAGSQGEYAGLLAIRAYHQSRGDKQRTVCLIPTSAHGTNPASAVMAGMQVVVVKCDMQGNVDLADLKEKALAHKDNLSCLMVTYPSTHGVFEEHIREVCKLVHDHGGQVYMDGANLNALVGLVQPKDLGADVCHINLHKTFCIPHGGGGPGMGPIAVASHLAPFLPGHSVVPQDGRSKVNAVSAAPYGSASILVIPWIYMSLMGAAGLTQATKMAILNANYIAKRLADFYPVVFKGKHGFVAHECILDLSGLKKSANVEVDDVAKRLMDYGFHAPTVSWPVPGSLMIEPTESESIAELDRFCDAMISIWHEAQEIIDGKADATNNLLKNSPHTAEVVCADRWDRPYSRERAAFPTEFTRKYKFWPSVGRVDAAFGDKNLICTCPPLS